MAKRERGGSGPHWGKLALIISISAVTMLGLAAAVFVLQPMDAALNETLVTVLALAGTVELGVALWFFRKGMDG